VPGFELMLMNDAMERDGLMILILEARLAGKEWSVTVVSAPHRD
jgi:hypothetical protein